MQILFEREHSRSAAYDGTQCIGIAEYEDGRRLIMHTEVAPSYEGQGIARRLIEEIIDEARRDGTKIIFSAPMQRR